jgi:hypothetical protein
MAAVAYKINKETRKSRFYSQNGSTSYEVSYRRFVVDARASFR